MERKSKLKGIALFCLLVGCLFVMHPAKTRAASGDVLNKKTNVISVYANKSSNRYMVEFSKLKGSKLRKAKSIKVTSSKKSVGTVKYSKSEKAIVFTAKKKGTTTLTVTAKVNGKKIKQTMKVKVVKYTTPFDLLTINGEHFENAFFTKGTGDSLEIVRPGEKVTIRYKLKKNWKLKAKWEMLDGDVPAVVKKSGDGTVTVTVTKNGFDSTGSSLELTNTKTKQQEDLYISVSDYEDEFEDGDWD